MTAVLSIFLIVLCRQPQAASGEDAFMRQAIGRPTGQNGYEEYAAAAEVALSPEFRQFEDYKPAKDQTTLLDVWQEQVRRFSAIANLVTQGNSKTVYDPKPRLGSSGSPELPGFGPVADYFARSAYVSLANGDPQTAERTFEAALQFVYNLDNGTAASGKAAADAANRLFKALDSDLPKLGVRELDRLGDAVTTLLAQEPSPLNNLRAIERADVLAAEHTLRAPQTGGPLALAIQSMNGQQREATLRQFLADEDTYLQSVVQTASQPESKWESVELDESNPVIAGLARSSIAGNSTLLQSSAKLRTKLRLLRALARLYECQWQYNVTPGAITDAVKAAELQDPLSGGPLTYVAQGKIMSVESSGASWTGPIKLFDKP